MFHFTSNSKSAEKRHIQDDEKPDDTVKKPKTTESFLDDIRYVIYTFYLSFS